MRILLLSAYCQPEEISSSHLNRNVSEAYDAESFRRLIITPTPTRGIDDETYRKYKHIRKDISEDGLTEIRRFTMFREGRNPIQRAIRYALCWVKHVYYGLRAKGCDVVYCGSTPPIMGTAGAIVSKYKKLPFIYELQDIFPDSLVGTGLTHKGSMSWKIGCVIENFTYKHADKIIVISEDFKRNIMAKGVPEEKIVVVYNWVDEKVVRPVADEENGLFEEFGIGREKFRVVYAGNLGNAQNIDIIMDAARRLKGNDGIEFVIFGKGGLEDEIKAAKAKEGLENLLILPLQPYERVSQVYSLGDVCIVACKPGLGGAAMPSKTWSIMSAGSAVLANFDEGELKNILEGRSDLDVDDDVDRKPCGVFTQAGDLDGFVEAILRLAGDKSLCEEMGRNGRRFVLENLTKEVGTRKYVDVIKSVVKE